MKKFYLTLFIFLLSLNSLFAATDSDIQNSFHQANEAYLARDFNKAIELYQNLEKKGVQSGKLFYNLGNSFYRTGRIGWTLYYYLKALELDPRNDDLNANYRLIVAKRVDQFELSVSKKIFQTFFFLNSHITLKELAIFTLLVYWSFFGLLALRVFRKKISLTVPVFVLGILSFIFLASTIAQFYTTQIQTRGVVVNSVVSVYSEPTDKSIKLFDLHEGTIGEITDQIKQFLRIELPDGKIGWIKKEDIQEIQ